MIAVRRLALYASSLPRRIRFIIAGICALVLIATLFMASGGTLVIAITVVFGLIFIMALPWQEL